MNPMNHEVFDELKGWISSEKWKTDKNISFEYDQEAKAWQGTYFAPWFMDLTEEELERIQEEELEDYYTFPVGLYIYDDGSFKLEFDPGLFEFMYRGYDTEDDRKAWEEFRELAREKGFLRE